MHNLKLIAMDLILFILDFKKLYDKLNPFFIIYFCIRDCIISYIVKINLKYLKVYMVIKTIFCVKYIYSTKSII